MNFGVPKEMWDYEKRVGLTPAGALSLIRRGHRVLVEHGAGEAAGFCDSDFTAVGAEILYSPEEIYGRSEIITKVSQLKTREYGWLKSGLTLLSFLNFVVAPEGLRDSLREKQVTALAYEMIREDDGTAPVLVPTSQVAGRMAPIVAGTLLESAAGGRGILLAGIPGVPPAAVVILGAGVLGKNAAQAFRGLGAQVTVLDRDYRRLEALDSHMPGELTTMISNRFNLGRVLTFADVVVGAVLAPGQRTPVIISRAMVASMRSRAVFIDFSIDQGGCSETSRPSTHRDPTYLEEDVIHYAVPNAPARVARTASYALTNAALPYLIDIGEHGIAGALERDRSLKRGLQVWQGEITAS